MQNFIIAKNSTVVFSGSRVPESAVYGHISDGRAYICHDFKVRKHGKMLFYGAKIANIKAVNTVRYERDCSKRSRVNSQREKIVWSFYPIPINSEIGKKITDYITKHYALYGHEPRPNLDALRSTRKNNSLRVADLQKRPKHSETVQRVPDGVNVHHSKPRAELYDKSGYFRKDSKTDH